MHGGTCKQYIFRSSDTSTFNAMRFDENPFTHQCEKGDEMLTGFKFRSFMGCSQVSEGVNPLHTNLKWVFCDIFSIKPRRIKPSLIALLAATATRGCFCPGLEDVFHVESAAL